MFRDQRPKKFSIILPVRNGGEYVKDCVGSILSQTLDDFNLHVLDNASSDGTLEWITSLNDERIKVLPSPVPLTIEQNWARALTIEKNEFMTLIGHDDMLEPKYLEIMDKLISRYNDASLYQAHFNYIDSNGNIIRSCKPMKEVETAKDFVSSFLSNNIDIMGTGFMMRSADYDKLNGMPAYPSLLFADFELWVNLTRLSYKATSPEYGFSFRLHQSTTSLASDVKLHTAFEQFVYFLKSLKTDKELNGAIDSYAKSYILLNCKSLSHRLLRTPLNRRDNLSVKTFVAKCKYYAHLLLPEQNVNPSALPGIQVAKFIDSTAIGRNLFLLFKKIYSKPVLK